MAPLGKAISRHLRKLLLGPTDLPLTVDVPLRFPQREVSVWLHGMGEPRDVTAAHSVACISPFLICIGFDSDKFDSSPGKRFSLKFRKETPDGELLAEIGLVFWRLLPATNRAIALFRALSCKNFCLPAARLLAHDLYNVYGNRKTRQFTGQDVSALEMRCNAAAFICPRPVVLVSVEEQEQGNIFPMNLLGALGGNYFGFALNSSRQAAALAGRLRRLALSSIPFGRVAAARELRGNHHQEWIRWEDLPFPTRKSKALHIPVPDFALSVRELNVEELWPLGTHTFFLARIAQEEILSEDSAFFMMNGQYAARRQGFPNSMPHAVSHGEKTAELRQKAVS